MLIFFHFPTWNVSFFLLGIFRAILCVQLTFQIREVVFADLCYKYNCLIEPSIVYIKTSSVICGISEKNQIG